MRRESPSVKPPASKLQGAFLCPKKLCSPYLLGFLVNVRVTIPVARQNSKIQNAPCSVHDVEGSPIQESHLGFALRRRC
jgi:hypothetical protein